MVVDNCWACGYMEEILPYAMIFYWELNSKHCGGSNSSKLKQRCV